MRIKDGLKPMIPPVEPGAYLAVCVHSIDMGDQWCEYKDKSSGYSHKVRLGFELAGETVEIDGKQEPRVLGREFSVARGPNSGLRKFVESWLGRKFASNEEFAEFDTNKLVGRPAQISVILNDTGEYANIDSIMQLPKGVPAPEPTVELIRFDISPWDDAAFQALPEWAQARIKKSTQYQKEHTPTDTVDFPEADAGTDNPSVTADAVTAPLAQGGRDERIASAPTKATAAGKGKEECPI